ncbi:MAG: hypothetical protein KC561_16110, partial [Myxococcales bacterium]|nr:hypothetical protein [Myxococcales bacterium]
MTFLSVTLLCATLVPACFFPPEDERLLSVSDGTDSTTSDQETGDTSSETSEVSLRTSLVQVSVSETFERWSTGWYLTENLVATSAIALSPCVSCGNRPDTVFLSGLGADREPQTVQGQIITFDLERDIATIETTVVGNPLVLRTDATPSRGGPVVDGFGVGFPERARGLDGSLWLPVTVGHHCPDEGILTTTLPFDQGYAGAPIIDTCGRVLGQVSGTVRLHGDTCTAWSPSPAIHELTAPTAVRDGSLWSAVASQQILSSAAGATEDNQTECEAIGQPTASADPESPTRITDETALAITNRARSAVAYLPGGAGWLTPDNRVVTTVSVLGASNPIDLNETVDVVSVTGESAVGTVVAITDRNDGLVLLTLNTGLSPLALDLAQSAPSRGETVFAIGHDPALSTRGDWTTVLLTAQTALAGVVLLEGP